MIVDAHLDLSMNAMEWNRDLTRPLLEINERENGMIDKPGRSKAVVCFDELRKGNIGLVVATQIARFVDGTNKLEGWNSPQQAWAQTQAQRAWYEVMEQQSELKKITSKEKLSEHIEFWNSPTDEKKPIGYILSLEGADSLINLDYLHQAYNYGLRAIGPAHYGPGRYANGTDASGQLSDRGVKLIKEMNKLNMILDATHLCDDAFFQAMEIYSGPICASHNNVRSIVNHNRQFTDVQIKILIQKDAVIGAALDAWMIVPNWERGISNSTEMNCDLEKVCNHFDHICQLAGNAKHVGIGSDLDGGFGYEQTPHDLKSISDLQKFEKILTKRGYSKPDINNIMYGNWIRFLLKYLP